MKIKNFLFISLIVLIISACSSKERENTIVDEDQATIPVSQSEESVSSSEPIKTPELSSDLKNYENEAYGFSFKYPATWENGLEACIDYEKACDGNFYLFGIHDPNQLGMHSTGIRISIIPTTDRQAVIDFTKNKIFDGKWFSFQKENSDGLIYTFNGSNPFEFDVRFIHSANKTYILSPALDSFEATSDKSIFDQVVSSFQTKG